MKLRSNYATVEGQEPEKLYVRRAFLDLKSISKIAQPAMQARTAFETFLALNQLLGIQQGLQTGQMKPHQWQPQRLAGNPYFDAEGGFKDGSKEKMQSGRVYCMQIVRQYFDNAIKQK